MSKDKTKNTEFYLVRETLMQSIVSDVVSFLIFVALLSTNYFLWEGEWFVTVFLMMVWLIVLTLKAKGRMKRFDSEEDLIEFLEKELRNE